MVAILHISDLHFTRDSGAHIMREVLLREARERVHDRPRGQKLLVVTGDFHNFWAPDYRDATEFMGELVKAMDVDPVEDVFIVPGNHDVGNDGALGQVLGSAVPDWGMHKAAALKLIDLGDYTFLDWRMEAFVPYCEFARGVGAYPTAADPIKDTTPARVHVRRWRDKLNVLHLNTALVADGKRKDDQLADVATATDPELWREWYRDDLPAIALGHNSFYDLRREQRDALAATFAQRNVSTYLCGDTHRAELDPERRTVNIGTETPIPNVVSAKGVADMGDGYSDFGYYWHEWDEETDVVEARFHRWRGEYLAVAAPEGIPVRYHMRCKKDRPKPGKGTSLTRFSAEKAETHDPEAELREYLATVLERKRDAHPSFQLLKVDEIDVRLYPNVDEINMCLYPIVKREGDTREYSQIPAQACVPAGGDGGGEGRCPVWDIVRRSWIDSWHRNIVIVGEAGIGKTVALFGITRPSEELRVPALYVPMYELVDRDGNARELADYIKASYSVHGDSIERLAARPWEGRPRLLVLLDGFNETPFELRRSILHMVNGWHRSHPGAQLVAVSRPMDGMDLSRELEGDPIPVTLAPLDDATIGEYLKDAGRGAPPRNSPIWEDLRYPLFLNLYVKTEGLKGQTPAGYPLHVMESESGGALIWNYLQRELLRHMKDSSRKAEEWVICCAVANEYVLPYIAYRMVRAQSMDVSYDQVEEWTKQALAQLDGDVLPSHLSTIWDMYQENHDANTPKDLFTDRGWRNIVLRDAGVLVPASTVIDGEAKWPKVRRYAFMHQNFRDCLAGLYLVNQAETASVKAFPRVWGQIQSHLALRYAAELMEQNERNALQLLWDANRKAWLQGGSGINN